MFTFDKLKYINHENAVNKIKEDSQKLRSLLLQLTFDFANKISGSIPNNDFLNHRNSIQLRLSSVLYHYDILASLNISGQKIITTKNFTPLSTHQVALRQDFLFDSIVFNVMSLFDYTGGLVKYIIEKNKQKQKTQWCKVANAARGQTDFQESPLAKAIDSIDRGWVKSFESYRSELIHYSDDFVNDGFTHNVKEDSYLIHISAPLSLKKHFKELKKENNLNINEVALWLIENSVNALLQITKELINFLDTIRRVPPGKEVFKIKTPSNYS